MSKSLATVAHRNPLPIEQGRRIVTNPDGTLTLHIPISFKRHGGRKYLITPTSADAAAPKDSILVAMGRAFHWQAQIENDPMLTIEQLAKKEGFGRSYGSRIMFLTLLAPDVIEAILDGKCPKGLTLLDLAQAGYIWEDQRRLFRQ